MTERPKQSKPCAITRVTVETVESAIGEKANAPTPAELVRRANALPEVEAKLAEAVEWCQLFAKYPRMLGDKQVVGNLRAFLARMEP